jgi:hypothetical protein
MKKIFLIPVIGCTMTLCAQNQMTNQVPDSILNKVIKSIDSFTFCNVSYKISRDCDRRNQSNCCSANLNPYNLQLGCYNGTSLFWSYFETEGMARQNFESIPAQWMLQSKKMSTENVTCILVDKKVQANKIEYITKENHKFYCIMTYGVVNDQPVLVQRMSSKEIKNNKDIQQLFQQIIKFSE